MDLKTIKTANSLITAPRIKKVAFGVSFFSHLLFFIALQLSMPELWKTNVLKTYKVELIRDVIDDIPKAKLEELEKENSLKKLLESNKDSQETISLDTKDKRYISYFNLIKKRLFYYWGYPKKAKEQLMEGKCRVLFSLSRDGQLVAVSITGSSGHEILDQESIDTIIRTAPFPPFPDSITANRLNIDTSFTYLITASKK